MKVNQQYKCVMDFEVNLAEDDGTPIKGKTKKIKRGEIWTKRGDDVRIMGEEVGLIKRDGQWIEIPQVVLEMYFDKVEKGD